MSDAFSSSESTPQSSSGQSPEELRQQADEAHKRQVWETAIQSYHALLKVTPNDIPSRLKLGHSYEGKSRDKDSKSFLLMAMEQYRQVLKIDPHKVDAHDALLAAATKANQLEELLEEYQFRLKKDPSNEPCKTTLKKIETLVFLKSDTAIKSAPGPHRVTALLFERLFPLLSLICFLGFLLLQVRSPLLREKDVKLEPFKNALMSQRPTDYLVLQKVSMSFINLHEMNQDRAIVALNTLIQTPELYAQIMNDTGQQDKLPSRVKRLLKQAQEATQQGKPLGLYKTRLLNRALLEAVYPDGIAPSALSYSMATFLLRTSIFLFISYIGFKLFMRMNG